MKTEIVDALVDFTSMDALVPMRVNAFLVSHVRQTPTNSKDVIVTITSMVLYNALVALMKMAMVVVITKIIFDLTVLGPTRVFV
tara:strand:- start:13103 stop:13354 length:252 start_codon:yes stop_codon:yes gene_type:complete